MKKKSIFLYDDHKLLSRRDFMAAAASAFSASLTLSPAVALLMDQYARAACGGASGSALSALPAFVQFNLSGGAMLAANFVPRDTGGNLIPSMNLMGLGSAASLSLSGDDLGASQMFFSGSGFLAGLRSAASGISSTTTGLTRASQYLNRTRVIGVVARSRDDTEMNPYDLTGLVAAAGLSGSLLPNLSTSGFRQTPSLINPPSPIVLNSYSDLENATGLGGALQGLKDRRGTRAVEGLFQTIQRLSESEARRLLSANVKNATELENLISCATGSNVSVVGTDPPSVDVRLQSDIATIWGITPTSSASSVEVIFASSVYATLMRYAGATRLERGGYDYHNGTRTTGDARDEEAGLFAGRMLQTAAALNQPLFLFVSTDGSCRSEDSDASDAPWVSDRGQAGLLLMLAYDPSGRPGSSVTGFERHQIGYLTSGQAADQEFIAGWDAEMASLAVFANYLRLGLGASWKSTFESVLGSVGANNPFTGSNESRILRFG